MQRFLNIEKKSWKYLVARMVEQYNFNTVLSDYM